ncbi:hypothetical protein Tco_0170065 [Tanacetum coccineum]
MGSTGFHGMRFVATLQGAPVSTDTEVGAHMREFESLVRRDTDEIYMRLDDEQGERQLLARFGQYVFRDRRTHQHTHQLKETERDDAETQSLQSRKPKETESDESDLIEDRLRRHITERDGYTHHQDLVKHPAGVGDSLNRDKVKDNYSAGYRLTGHTVTPAGDPCIITSELPEDGCSILK